MTNRLQNLKDNLEFYCSIFTLEEIEQALKDYMDETFNTEEYFRSKDDAFEKGQSFGMYFEQCDILDEITKIIEEGK